jgi:hypothetical protein
MIALLQSWLSDLGLGWFDLKMLLERSLAFDSDALHVAAGVVVQLLAAAVLRTSVGSTRPWLVVLALELANETVDLWVEKWPDPAMQWGEGLKDVLLTLALPTLLLIVSRTWPKVLRR